MLLSAMPHACILPLTRPGCCAAGVVADKTRRDTVMRFSGLAMLGAPSLPASLTISKHRPPDEGRSLPGALCSEQHSPAWGQQGRTRSRGSDK